MSPAAQIRSLAAVIASISVVGIAFGLNMPLLSLVLESRHVESSMIGLNAAAQALSTVLATPFIPRQIAALGAHRYLLSCLAVICSCILLFPMFDHLGSWFAIRFVMGIALTGVFVVSESWILQIAKAHTRGRILGIYATVLSAGFAVGPLLIRITGIEGRSPFLLSAGIVALAAIPILIARADAPDFGANRNLAVGGFIRVAPVAILAALVFGATETCVLSLLPSYGLKNGLTVEAAATLLAVVGAGSVALQVPIGWLSDRFDRSRVLLLCAGVGLAGVALLPVLIAAPAFLWALLFVWGGVIVGLYTVGLALLGERVDDADLAAANAAFIQAYGLGAIVGPVLAGAAMSGLGPDGLPLTLGLLFAAYLVFAAAKARA
jgi:MFS family permease